MLDLRVVREINITIVGVVGWKVGRVCGNLLLVSHVCGCFWKISSSRRTGQATLCGSVDEL